MKSKIELLKEVEKFVPIFKEINNISKGVLSQEHLKNFIVLNQISQKWLRKLSNPKFEVAIIGTEKAGKSTFANGLLKNNYLPEAIGRCTFTTTVIESSQNKNQAIVKFFTTDEFISKFESLCEEIEFKNFNYNNATLDKLEEFLKDKSSAIQTSNAVDDIKAIVESKNLLQEHLGRDIEVITENIKENIRPYIVTEEIARTVKSITIESSELKDMQDLIIYDVPGFDSPTNLHLEQAKKYMIEADVVVMLTSIADRVSFVKAQTDFLNETKDEYGTSLADKMIVVASKFDKHLENSKTESEVSIGKYIQILVDELNKYHLFKEKNLFRCSSLGYLENNGIIPRTKISKHLNELGMSDDFEKVEKRIIGFFENEALEILNDVVRKDINSIENFLFEFKQNHNPSKNEEKIDNELYDSKSLYKNKKFDEILDLVDKYLSKIDDTDFNIDSSIKEQIEQNWINELILDEDKTKSFIKKINDGGIEQADELNIKIRKNIYNKSLSSINKLVTKVIINKDTTIISELTHEIKNTFSIDKGSALSNKLEEVIKSIIIDHVYTEKSYRPLMMRFLEDVFEVLLRNKVTNNPSGERIKRFDKYYSTISSLLNFDLNYDRDESPYCSELFQRLISTRYNENLVNENGNIKNILIQNTKVASNYEEVKNEINQDLENLKLIFNNILLNAMMLEKPFLDSLKKQVSSVKVDITDGTECKDNKKLDFFDKFIELNYKELDRENYNKLSGNPELNKKLSNIISFIDSMNQ